jgi:large subunit ribosomal protein L30
MVTKAKTVKVKLIRSPIGYNKKQRLVLKGLGLGRLQSEKELKNTAAVRGMINKVIHLVSYEVLS